MENCFFFSDELSSWARTQSIPNAHERLNWASTSTVEESRKEPLLFEKRTEFVGKDIVNSECPPTSKVGINVYNGRKQERAAFIQERATFIFRKSHFQGKNKSGSTVEESRKEPLLFGKTLSVTNSLFPTNYKEKRWTRKKEKEKDGGKEDILERIKFSGQNIVDAQ